MLVSRAIARVGLRNEQALERDSDHGNIARIDDTNFNTLVHWLLKLSHQALQSPEPIQASMTDQSVSSSYSQRRFPESGSELDAEIRNVLHFEQIHTTFPSLNLPCHALWYHQENPYFVGREENLSYLQKVLLPDSSTKQSAFAIWGKGGVGKTQLALKFAFKNRAKYESILWAQADTGDKLLQSFSDYCLDLGLLKQQARDPRTARDTLLRWYATTKVPWLLIFDNADDISVLPGFWPHGTTGSILITSRDPTSATSIAAGQGAELLELSEVDAVIMMEGLLGRKIESKEADLAKSIARKVEYLPLGINSAVGTILETRCSLKDFTAQWDRIQDIIADSDVRRINRPTSRYEFSLNTAWEASLTALNSAARFLMEVLCLLDPDGISDEILKTGSQQLTLLRGSRLLRSTGILLTASLISVISEKDNTRYHIHRLIRGYVYSQMSQEARQNAFDAAMNMILSVWPFPPQHNRTQGSYWMAQEKYLPHVKSMRMIFDDSYEHEVEDGIPPLNPTKDFCRLLNSAAWYCYTRGLYQTSYPLLDAAERCGLAISKSSSQNKQYLVDTWQTRGAIATEAGQFERSREYFTKAGEYLAEMIDSGYVKRPDTREAQIAGGLGNSYHLLGNAKLSLQWYLKSLDLWTAKTAPIYGIILCRCLLDLGRLDEASDRLEAVLEERKQLFGPDDTVDYKTGQALYILGNVRIAQGRLDEAFQIHCRALKQWKATYGPEHRHTAYACHKVALHLERMGKYEDAKSVFKQAIEILESSSEKENNKREIARTLFKLGGLLQNAEGEGLRKRAVQLRAEVLGMQVTDSSPVTERTFEDLVSPWAR